MKIEARNEGGVTIISPKGKITIGVGDVALREAVYEALEAGARNILLDLAGVTTIDSSGIGEMVNVNKTVAERGGKLRLVGMPPKVADMLQMTHLIMVFDTFDNLEEAIASYQ